MQLNSDKIRHFILILGMREDQIGVPVFRQDCNPFHGIYFLNRPLLTFSEKRNELYSEKSCSVDNVFFYGLPKSDAGLDGKQEILFM